MTLAELQQDLIAVCLEESPDPARLSRLGQPSRFLDYRRMVRTRLHDELRRTFKRTAEAVGEAYFSELFAHYMAQPGPRSRFFHHIPVEFAAAVREQLAADDRVPAYAVDLLRLEAARREVANLPGLSRQQAERLRVFDFEHLAVLQPALRLLDLQHAVQEPRTDERPYPAAPTFIAVYRPAEDARVRHFVVNPVTFDLLNTLAQRPQAMKQAVERVSRARRVQVDDTFLEALCEVLSDFIEGGLLLGCQVDEPE